MKKDEEYYTLITGASSGIGKAMSEEFARQRHNLLLISLPDTGLSNQCENISSKYNVASRFLEIDLRDHRAPEKILNFVHEENLKINTLINNIGIGHIGFMGNFPANEIDEMLMLNIHFTTHLTNLFIKDLKSCPESRILNMGSLGGYAPAPSKSVYMASKAYIYYFSRGLSFELENSSIKVSVAMPGPVKSNQKMINRILNDGSISRYIALNPEEVAKYIVPRFLRGKKIIIPGKMARTVFALGLILPYGITLYSLKKTFHVEV
ncbi:MAG: SDR family NAD(P)-dependent oxidoreductase [Prolixibacteraceae bacterium]|jgi:hypothetical protein